MVRRKNSRLNPSSSPCHLVITSKLGKGYSRRQAKVLMAEPMTQRLGPRSSRAWAGLTGKHKHKVFASQRQSLLAATGSL